MKKKTRAIILLLILLPVSCTFYLLEYKFYYTVGSTTFTFWNTSNGCYIMPYKYKGLLFPKNNYMIVSNGDYVRIFVGDHVVYVFSEDPYKRPDLYFTSDKSKYKVFPYRETDSGRVSALEHCKKMGYTNIFIDTFTMSIDNNGVDKFTLYINIFRLPILIFIIGMKHPKAFFYWLADHIFFL
ncbi:hypothetical protein [Treponema pedis]|uniref:hypothetical protein n=1 Tax=Treponema pedis TaxID=409322 RepID=UPI00041FEB5B|nr:hypothetical protein [Treponema pedis]